MSHEADVKFPVLLDCSNDAGTNVAATTLYDPEGERKVRQAIENAAQWNATLLSDMMKTADAVGALQNCDVNLNRVKDELAAQDKAVEQTTLEAGVYRLRCFERRNHSFMKWLAILTRMRREFDKQLLEAERVFHDALASQSKAEQRQKALQHDLENITRERVELATRVKEHEQAHQALDDLYDIIFAGPTPGYPDEDELEAKYNQERTDYNASTKILKASTTAKKTVDVLGAALERIVTMLDEAEDEAESSFILFDYATALLHRAGGFINHALQLTSDTMQSRLEPLDTTFLNASRELYEQLTSAHSTLNEGVDIGSLGRSGILNIVASIKEILASAKRQHKILSSVIKKYNGSATRAVTASSRKLEDARQALHAIRQSAFEMTVGFGAAAPAYHECCDRAEGYTNDVLAQCDLITAPSMMETELPLPPKYEVTEV